MVLDETLRDRIDEVARRRRNSELLAAAVRGALGLLASFALVRGVVGLLSGGQGWLAAAAMGLAAGITYAVTSPRHRHTRLTAARFIDDQLSLDDRLATAVECSGFDATPGNRVERWLFVDVANQARFIKPEELVRYHMPREARWLVPLMVAGLLLSLPIYPRGLSWQLGGSDVQQAARRAGELTALADQIDRLSLQHPELREVASELRRLGEQLRNRQLPQDEALRLLRELEQELQVGVPAGGLSTDLDISQIQSLAQRLRRVEAPGLLSTIGRTVRGGLPGGGPGGSDVFGEYSDYDGYGTSASGGRSQNGSAAPWGGGEYGQATDDPSRPGGTSGSRSGAGSRGSGGYHDEESEYAASAYGPPGAGGTGGEGGQPGGSMAGTGKGSDARLADYQSPDGLTRVLAPIRGQIGEGGPLFSGKAQGNVPPEGTGPTGPAGRSPAITSASVEKAVRQENIPLAYRQWVRRYFAALEPDAAR